MVCCLSEQLLCCRAPLLLLLSGLMKVVGQLRGIPPFPQDTRKWGQGLLWSTPPQTSNPAACILARHPVLLPVPLSCILTSCQAAQHASCISCIVVGVCLCKCGRMHVYKSMPAVPQRIKWLCFRCSCTSNETLTMWS